MAANSDARDSLNGSEQEPLVLIPDESYADFYNTLQKDVPNSLSALGILQTVIRWRKIGNIPADLKLYAPFGDFKDGTCVGIYDTDSLHAVTLYTRDATDQKLQEALLATDLINWCSDDKRLCMLVEVPDVLVPTVKQIAAEKNIKTSCQPAVHFWMEKERAIKLEVRCPPGVRLAPLTVDLVPYLDQYWPFKFNGAQDYLRTLLERNFGIGAFFEGNDMPVAWVVLNHTSFITMLYVLETHRRKGYAELVCNAMAKKMAELDIYPRATVMEGNDSSKRLFTRMGYKASHIIHYMPLKRM